MSTYEATPLTNGGKSSYSQPCEKGAENQDNFAGKSQKVRDNRRFNSDRCQDDAVDSENSSFIEQAA